MEENIIISFEENISGDENQILQIISELKEELKFIIESLEFNFVSNPTILEINKKHLNHNYFTDIITFNYSGETDNLDGEIFISYDEAVENAKRFECDLKDELLRLVIHGILHMVGYDDIEESDKNIMKQKEDEFVNKLNNKIVKEFVFYEN